MNTKLKKRMTPPHVGLLLKEELIEANNLSVTAAAELLGITRVALSNVINEKAGVSPELAVRISRVFGGSAEMWVRMQASYDLAVAEKRLDSNKVKLKLYHAVACL